MITQLLKKAVGKIKIGRGSWYMIVDLRTETIRLPDGTIIPRDRIISIDTARKVIVFIDKDGKIREVKYG